MPKFLLVIIAVFLPLACLAEDGFVQAPAALHISSAVSDGKLQMAEIISLAKAKGFKVLVITDRDLMRWEYGLWPFRQLLKKTVEEPSVLAYGAARYLQKIESLQKANPDCIIIPAVESAPFYYWSGSILRNDLTLNNWHVHMLAIGLGKPADYLRLPITGNKAGLTAPFSLKDLLLFWPLALIAAAGFILRSKRKQRGYLYAVLALGAVGLVFAVNNFPFRSYRFDQYHGNPGIAPYQHYIDYVNNRGGLTFWAHPETANQGSQNGARYSTDTYERFLMESRDYTGFAVLHEGYRIVGKQGGIWDNLLLDYCRDKRQSPVWAIGSLGYDRRGELSQAMDGLRTVLLVSGFSRRQALEALAQGRYYVVGGQRSSGFELTSFILKDSVSGEEKQMGQTLVSIAPPQVIIRGRFLRGQPSAFKIQLICNSRVVQTFTAEGEFAVDYLDEEAPGSGYYRLYIEAEGVRAYSNPVFIRRAARP